MKDCDSLSSQVQAVMAKPWYLEYIIWKTEFSYEKQDEILWQL